MIICLDHCRLLRTVKDECSFEPKNGAEGLDDHEGQSLKTCLISRKV